MRKRAANEARLAVRAKKPPILTFDGTSNGRPGKSASAGVIELPDFTRHTVTKFMASSMSDDSTGYLDYIYDWFFFDILK